MLNADVLLCDRIINYFSDKLTSDCPHIKRHSIDKTKCLVIELGQSNKNILDKKIIGMVNA
ncbi:MAG TPA: hypothetical protein VLL98_01465 [Rickettsiales bacterium]|nr:hypothetical protein [Rickettsiales bacterium]